MAGVIGLAVGGLAVVYPWVLDGVLARVTVRALAVSLLALLVLSLPLRSRLLGGGGPLTWLPAAGLGALLAVAGAVDDARVLRLIPAWVYLCLAGIFAASLRAPDSIVERGARWLVPVAPTFIRRYCRKTTALWVAIFLAVALTTSLLALQPDGEAWRQFTSRTVWLGIGVLSLVEFLFRKSWFRYYARGGPFERLWSGLFPAAETERGRRSQAYIVEMREQEARGSRPHERSVGWRQMP
jgi:uncharacterized membrane protein